MELSKRLELSNQIIDDETLRYVEIYKITNLTNNKIYIGQAVSHILNHKRYRPYGREGRFRCHISEAFSNKKNQCHYLNSAIRKYGTQDFIVELVEFCDVCDANEREVYYIDKYNSMFPEGYNLNAGGKVTMHTKESKLRVSSGLVKYYKEQKFDRFKNIKLTDINDDITTHIKILKRHGEQYGWYVYIKKCKADFGGSHINIDDSYKQAIEFINELKLKMLNNVGETP